eukprot:238892_1
MYANIKKWKTHDYPTAVKDTAINAEEEEKWIRYDEPAPIEDEKYMYNEICNVQNNDSNSDEWKYSDHVENTDNIDYIGKEQNDGLTLNLFTAITSATKDVAALFLADTEWNIQFAINKYYAFSGDPSQLNDTFDEVKEFGNIYIEGVEFWYWQQNESMPANAVYIKPKFKNLKDELISGRKWTQKMWNVLKEECEIII